MWKCWIFPPTIGSKSSRLSDTCSQHILLVQSTVFRACRRSQFPKPLYVLQCCKNPNRFEYDWGRKVLSSDDPSTVTQSPTVPIQCLSRLLWQSLLAVSLHHTRRKRRSNSTYHAEPTKRIYCACANHRVMRVLVSSESKAISRSQSSSFVLILLSSCPSQVQSTKSRCLRRCINAPRQGSFLVAHRGLVGLVHVLFMSSL